MRLDLLLIDNPVERVSRAIGRVAGKIGGLDTETPLRALDHGLSCSDLCLPNGAGRFDIHDDAELNVDEIIVRVGEERWPAHRAGPLRGWIGRRDKFRRRLACRAKRRIVQSCQILLHGAAGAMRIARLVPLRSGDRSLLVGVRHDQARIDCEPFTADQSGRNTGLNDTLKYLPKHITLAEPLMTGTGRRRCRWRMAASSHARQERHKVGSSVPCWQTCFCTMRSTGGWRGPTRTSRSSGMWTISSVTVRAPRRRRRYGARLLIA